MAYASYFPTEIAIFINISVYNSVYRSSLHIFKLSFNLHHFVNNKHQSIISTLNRIKYTNGTKTVDKDYSKPEGDIIGVVSNAI